MIDPGKYYTVKQTAEILQLHPRTILSWIEYGKIPAHRPGWKHLIKGADIQAVIDRSKVTVY